MAASIIKTTVEPTMAAKLYTNSGTTDVVATLNMMSQDNTKNPKVNVSYSSDSALALNSSPVVEGLTLGSYADDISQLVNLGMADTPTKGTFPYGMNITDNTYGYMEVEGTGDYKYGSQFIDPYYFVSPTSWSDVLVTPAFAKSYSNSMNYWFDFAVAFAGNTFSDLFGTSPSGTTDQDHGPTWSYYGYSAIFDPKTQLAISIQSNSYMSITQWYGTFGTGTPSINNGNRSSDGCVYDQVSSSWSSYRVPQAYWPWSKDMHSDHGVFLIDTTHDGWGYKRAVLLNMNSYVRTTFDSYNSSPQDWIQSNRGRRIRMRGVGQIRWLKYDPTAELYYICIGQQQNDDTNNDSTGLYSFPLDWKGSVTDQWYNSDSGGNDYIDEQVGGTNADPFTKVETTNIGTIFEDWKTTTPARIGAKTWVSYDKNGDAFFSSDLVTWNTIAVYDPKAPSGTTLMNETAAGTRYYYDGTDFKTTSSGYGGVAKEGYLEYNTEIGRYERTGIIIPKGESLYMENIDTDTAISASLLTMDI